MPTVNDLIILKNNIGALKPVKGKAALLKGITANIEFVSGHKGADHLIPLMLKEKQKDYKIFIEREQALQMTKETKNAN